MALTRQQLTENIEAMESQGAPQADIQEYINSRQITSASKQPTQSKSLFRPVELLKSIGSRAKQEFGSSSESIQQAQQRQEAGKQGGLRTTGTALAQGAQAGLGTAFGAVLDVGSAVLPDFIENPIRRKLGAEFDTFIASEKGQSLVQTITAVSDKIDTLQPKNQQLVKDIADAALTAADIGTSGAVSKASTKGLSKVGAAAGTKGKSVVTKANKDAITEARSKLADLIIDTSTPTKRAAKARATKEGGFFSSRDVTPNFQENLMMDELVTTPGIRVNRSALFNLNALTKETAKEAGKLRNALTVDNFIFPKKEAVSRLSSQLDNLKVSDTDIIGDAEKLADRVFDKMKVFIEAGDGTGLGAWDARIAFDKWVKAKKPKAFEKQDAFNTAVTSARRTVNDFIEEKATKTDVKKSLKRQSRLRNAEDILATKASKESSTGFVRLLDRATEVLGTKSRVVQLMAAAVGIGGLGAAASFAPAVAAVGGVVGVSALLIKAIKSPASRKLLGEALITIEKLLPKATAKERAVLTELKDEITSLLDKDGAVNLTSGNLLRTDIPTVTGSPKVNSRFTRDASLSGENKAIEARAFKKIEQNEKELLQLYKQDNGDVINTDDFRKLFTAEGYAGHNAAAVHEPASYLAKKAFSDRLKNPEKVASFLAGGSGTGKSSAVKNLPAVSKTIDNSAVILDSNLSSLKSATKKIDEAKKAGKLVNVVFVYRDPMDSFENGVVTRMLNNPDELGRLVPAKVVAQNHIDSWNVIRQLQDRGVHVSYIDNSLGAGNARVVTRQQLEGKVEYPSVEALTTLFRNKAKQLKKDGTIKTNEQLKGYLD